MCPASMVRKDLICNGWCALIRKPRTPLAAESGNEYRVYSLTLMGVASTRHCVLKPEDACSSSVEEERILSGFDRVNWGH